MPTSERIRNFMRAHYGILLLSAWFGWFGLLAATEQPSTPIVTVVSIRPTDIDEKGHVNNARYVEYLQIGRWKWLEAHGLTQKRLLNLDTVLVVVNVNLDYKAEVRIEDDQITVITTPEKYSNKTCTLRQIIQKADGTFAASGTVTLVAIDPKTRKAIPLPDPVANAFRD